MTELSKAFADILPLRLSKEAAAEVSGDFVSPPKKITAAKAIALSITAKAMRGDTKAYEIIKQAMGEGSNGPISITIDTDDTPTGLC